MHGAWRNTDNRATCAVNLHLIRGSATTRSQTRGTQGLSSIKHALTLHLVNHELGQLCPDPSKSCRSIHRRTLAQRNVKLLTRARNTGESYGSRRGLVPRRSIRHITPAKQTHRKSLPTWKITTANAHAAAS